MQGEQQDAGGLEIAPEMLQAAVAAVVGRLYAEFLAAEKGPKAVPAKGSRYNYLPRGINQSQGFSDIPEDWAEQFRCEPPVKVHERRLTRAELSQGAAIRPFASSVTEEERAWFSNVSKHRKICGPWAKHHESSCPYRKPREIEKPNPTLAVWKRDRRRPLGGRWLDPVDGVPVGGHPEPLKVAWTHEDRLLQREEAASKWKGWTAEKDGVVMLEANMLAAMQGLREVDSPPDESHRERR